MVTPEEGLPAALAVLGGGAQTGTVGQPLPDSLIVRVTDSRDRPVQSTRVAFVILAGGAGADVIPDTAFTDADGRARARWVLGSLAGLQRVEARVLGKVAAGTLKATFDATALPDTPDTVVAVKGQNQTATVGQVLPDSLVVRVTDRFGNPIAGRPVTWAAIGGGSVSAASTVTGADGRTGVLRTLGPAAGPQSATATAAGVPGSPVVFAHTAVAGGAVRLVKVTPDPITAPAGLPVTVTVQAQDANINGVPGRNVNWVVNTGGGSANPVLSVTDQNGFASTTWTLGATAGTNTLTAASAGLQVQFTANGTANQPVAIQGNSPTSLVGTAGQAVSQPPSVKVVDQNGNGVQGVTVTFTVTAGGGTVSDGASTGASVSLATSAQGVATLAAWTLGSAAGPNTVQASASGQGGPLSGSPVTFSATGNPGAAARLAFQQQPSNAVAGAAISPTVTVRIEDQNGNLVNSTAQVTLSLASNPGGGTLSGGGPVSAVGGVASFPSLSIDRAGTGYTLRASSGALTQATSNLFDIAAGPATRLVFTTQPSAVAAGQVMTPAVVVEAQDALGNTDPRFSGAVTLTLVNNPGGATLSGGGPVNAVAGVATFSSLTVDKAGNGYTLGASAAGLGSATSTAFNVGSGAPAQLRFLVQPTTTAAGAPITPAVQVEVLDAQGNRVTSSTAPVTLVLGNNPGGAVLSGGGPVNAVNGVATFGGLSLNRTGTGYTLVASSPSLTGATSAAFDVTPGSGVNLVFTTQPSNVTAGAAITPAVVVTAQDGLGNTVTSFTGQVSLALGNNPGGGTLSGGGPVSAVAGVATFSNLTIDKAGTGYTLTAAATGAAAGTSAPFNVSPAAASQLVFVTQPSNSVAGSVIAPAVQVAVRDAFGNTVTGAATAITVGLGANPGGGTLSGTLTRNASGGIATFNDLSINVAASGYTLTASGGGLPQVTSVAFDIQVGNGNKLAFVVQPSNALVGAPIAPAIQVAVQDAAGNTVPTSSDSIRLTLTPTSGGLSGTVGARAVNGIATFNDVRIGQAGTGYTLTAFAPVAVPALISATSAAFDVTAASTTAAITGQSSTTTVVGQPYTVTFAVQPVAPASGTPTGTVTVSDGTDSCQGALAGGAGSCVLTSTTAGIKSLVASYGGDANFGPSISVATPHTVNKGTTLTTITSDLPDPSVTGELVAVDWQTGVSPPTSGVPGGTVTVTVSGGTESCSAPVGAQTCQVALLARGTGTRTFTATYSGDANFNGSSDTEGHLINRAATTTTITGAPSAVEFGQPVAVSFSVTANPPGGGTPSGTVTVTDSAGASCSAPATTGSCSLTPTAAGPDTLTAVYPQDANYLASSATGVIVTVNPAATTTTITSHAPDPSVVGQGITVSVGVSAQFAVPAGSVTVSDGSVNCTIPTLVNGTGSCTLTPSTAGTKTLTATYTPSSGNFTASTSAGVAHTVNPAAPVVAITSHAPDPSVTGEGITVNVTVTGAGATPTGSVTVTATTGESCTIASLANGAGSCSIAFATATGRTLTASYGGDANYSPASSSPVSHTVNPAATILAVTGDAPDPSSVGQAYTVTWTFGVASPGSGTPTGSVTVSDGQGGSCSAPATPGAGSCSLTSTVAGNLTLTASYPGDGNYLGSSGTEPHQVTAGSSSTAITGHNPVSSVVGQLVTFDVTVTGAGPTPTGTVTVSDGTQSCTLTLSGGTGACGIAFATAGARSVTATYGGDANHAGSSSAPVAHTVNPAAPVVAITSHAPDPSVTGEGITVNVTVTGAGATPTGSVTVTATTGESCAIASLANGAGSCAIAFASAVARTLTANYSGDANYTAASSAGVSHTVNPAGTVVSITAHSPDPSVVGQSYTVSWTVSVAPPGAGTPTGSVTVSDGTGAGCGPVPVGAGSCAFASTSPGSKTLTVSYSGDANFTASSSTVSHTVDPFGAPASLQFTVQPSNTQVLAPITPAVEVSIRDAFGNLVATATDQVTLAIGNDPNGGLSQLLGTNPRNASGGVAVFDDLRIDLIGNGFTLVASSGSLASDTSSAFDITP